MTRFIPPLCALLAGLGLLTGTARPAAPPIEDDTQKIAFLTDAGPLLIELHVRIDGKPLAGVHRQFMDRLFDHLDRNRDGVLSREEAAAAPPASALSTSLGLLGFRRGFPGNPQALRLGRDGKVTRQEMAAYYRRTGLAPFQINGQVPQPPRVRRALIDNQLTAEQLTNRLFKLLDTDGDGKLSRKELEAAPAILGKLDIDEDEMITPDELMGEEGADTNPLAALAGRRAMPAQAPSVVSIAGDDSFSGKPADVTLTVRLGQRSGAPAVVIGRNRPVPAGVEVRVVEGGVTIQRGTSRLDLRIPEPTRFSTPVINVRDQIKTLFQRTDANNDGFVDRMEARRTGFFMNIFDAVDRDGDGKISEKELMAYLDEIAELGKQGSRSCVSLSVSSEGKGLFDLLDSNGDGKLSVRELRNAHQLLARFDRDGDGKLSRTEVPRRYQGTLTLGASGGNDPFVRVIVFNPQQRGQDRRAAAPRGPLWFQKMDRNRDGDVSRKEFLGTDAQFREIDTDGDGLISVAEAEAYDRRKRQGRR
jgi:Ca2+-binding EF-hand superfamily protein